MGKDLRFYKDYDNRWYVDLPDWKGSKAELEMVAGADTMLEMIAEGHDAVQAHFDINPYEGGDELVCKEIHPEGGATYILKTYRGVELNLQMWLCDVTTFVFGYFPKIIYFYARLSIF